MENAAKYVFIYLVAASLVSIVFGFVLLGATERLSLFFAVSLIGFSGSAIAALTSSLDRYARGFELAKGIKEPRGVKGETFNRRMIPWFHVRPFIGLVAAPVFVWGVGFFTDIGEQFTASPENLGFTAFIGGLLAKSVLDLIKCLFKNVFKT